MIYQKKYINVEKLLRYMEENMEDKLEKLEERVNVLADKLREQYAINSKLIELIKEIGDSEFHDYVSENQSLNNSVNKLNEMNYKFEKPILF